MRILLAHDGSPSARQVVDLLGAVRWSRDMTLRVISSAEGTATLPDPSIGGLPRVLLGSVARNVVHGGGASVLIVHAPAGN